MREGNKASEETSVKPDFPPEIEYTRAWFVKEGMKSDWLLPLGTSVLLAALVIGSPADAGHAKGKKTDAAQIYGRIQFVESFPGVAK